MQKQFAEAKVIYSNLLKSENVISNKIRLIVSMLKMHLEENNLADFVRIAKNLDISNLKFHNFKKASQIQTYLSLAKCNLISPR
jgi:hypothetical protein